MTTEELDPLIHVPTRLKIVATLAALPDGDGLSFTRLQDMLELTPGNLIIQLRKLEEAGYLASEKTRTGSTQRTTVAMTGKGRAALSAYTRTLRNLLGGLGESGGQGELGGRSELGGPGTDASPSSSTAGASPRARVPGSPHRAAPRRVE